MDILQIIETFGLPVAGVIGLAFYISKKDKEAAKQQEWIQSDLTKDIHRKFNLTHDVVDKDLRMILIKLIDQQKIMQLDLKKIETAICKYCFVINQRHVKELSAEVYLYS